MLDLIIEMRLVRMPVMKFERYCVRPPGLGLRRNIIFDFTGFLVEGLIPRDYVGRTCPALTFTVRKIRNIT